MRLRSQQWNHLQGRHLLFRPGRRIPLMTRPKKRRTQSGERPKPGAPPSSRQRKISFGKKPRHATDQERPTEKMKHACVNQSGSRAKPSPQTEDKGREWFRGVQRFMISWAAFFAAYWQLSVCPFCGQSGCPGGAGTAGFIGALAAALLFFPRRLIRLFARRPR